MQTDIPHIVGSELVREGWGSPLQDLRGAAQCKKWI